MKIGDIVSILLVLGIGVSGIVYSLSAKPGKTIKISSPYGSYRYSLTQERTLKIPGKLGDILLEIKGGAVRITQSTCPLKICIKKGWIYRQGDSIICLPNQVIIRVEGDKEQDFDAISE